MAYNRQALAELHDGQAKAAPTSLSTVYPDARMDEGLILGYYCERRGRFISPQQWTLERTIEDFYATHTPDDSDRNVP